MKTSPKFSAILRKRGVALILVISILALLTVLMLAMFTTTDNEFKSTQGYVASEDARRFGDIAVNIVIGQLQKAAVPNPNSTARFIHATQPGEARTYNTDGSFNSAYKLYSSDTMQIKGTSATDELHCLDDSNKLTTWNQFPDSYTDLNEPVIRAGMGTSGVADVYFPIVDPTGYQTPYVTSGSLYRSNSQTNIEGFSYGLPSDTNVPPGVILPSGSSSGLTSQRLPMPVQWMYVLQDGTMGTMSNAKPGLFTAASGGGTPSASNPIVGRVAFWTDDESCKININTASEETFWATPRFFHERDHEWAEKPPQAKEFQRFPGHPATVCLSSVLFPDLPGTDSFDFFGQNNPTSSTAFQEMQRIFDIAPKIARGGSFCGTQVFASDDQTGYTVAKTDSGGVDMTNSIKERLYASLDELLYSQKMDSTNTLRLINDQWVPTLPAGATTTPNATTIANSINTLNNSVSPSLQQTIQRSRFFLTANSRAPEFSILGVPKVCMWPVSEATDNKHRTVYDSLIAFCATLKGSSTNSSNNFYYIQRGAVTTAVNTTNRGPSHRADYDVGIARNVSLLQYLKLLLRSPMPQTSGYGLVGGTTAGTSKSIGDKYGSDNLHTIIAEIFDYIRSTNLYDDILSGGNVKSGTKPPLVPTALTTNQIYSSRPPTYYTYTDPMIWNQRTSDPISGLAISNAPATVAVDGWPGHGTVSPSLWVDEGQTYRGMGRFVTLSEIGIHLICTGDGETDSGSYTAKNVKSGGRTSEKVSHKDQNVWMDASESMNNKTYWYSNFPPYPGLKSLSKYNLTTSTSDLAIINQHPAWKPEDWNLSLLDDTVLASNEKRVQALLDMELFCPSEGYTIMHPEWTLVLDGSYLSGITMNNVALWNTTQQIVVKSNQNIFGTNTGASRTGGTVDPSDLYSGRGINGIGRLPADSTYDGSASSDPNAQMTNAALASGFFTIKSDQNISLAFPASGKGLLIKVYDTHNWGATKEVQDITVDFAKSSGKNTIDVPPPCLVTISTEWRHFLNGATFYDVGPMDAPHWWCFNHDGCIGRYPARTANITAQNIGSYSWVGKSIIPPTTTDAGGTAGRFYLQGNSTVISNGPPGVVKGVPTSYTNSSTYNGPANSVLIYSPPPGWIAGNTNWAHDYGADVVRTLIPALGDYRILASMYTVPSNIWIPHRLWKGTNTDGSIVYLAHNFSADNSDDAGYDFNLNASNLPNKPQFMKALGVAVNMSTKIPDMPQDDGTTPQISAAGNALNSYGDFDNGPGTTRDGAYNNKPDEGNFASLQYIFGQTTQHTYRGAYFYGGFEMQSDPTNGGYSNNTMLTSYFTPNRLISSPVMFGSLVTNVFDPTSGFSVTGYPTTGCGRPWQTLLFRPHVAPTGDNSLVTVGGALKSHPGGQNPPDHYLLDLFNMPVVEPYAISEPLSQAGKINLNYQIVPFTYIHRATAVYAAMKGELMRCIRTSDNNSGTNSTLGNGIKYKSGAALPTGQTFPPIVYWNDTASTIAANNRLYWARHIDPVETLAQLEERFAVSSQSNTLTDKRQGLLRSASQICELHMIPANPNPQPTGIFPMPSSNATSRDTNMQKFWGAHCLTGDNTREEIYSHLYPKFTTRSNTFRIHVRTQSLRKARSTSTTTFDTTAGDKVLSEFRGSYLLERYVDPNDTSNVLPDYGGSTSPLTLASLDSYYRFHVIEAKRFNP